MSVPFNVPVAMQSSVDEEECVLLSALLSHVESGARFARLIKHVQILGRRVEFDQPIPDPIHQPVVPPPPRIWPVCWRRVGGPPDNAPLEDRRMEWSPVQPGASGGSSPWTFDLFPDILWKTSRHCPI